MASKSDGNYITGIARAARAQPGRSRGIDLAAESVYLAHLVGGVWVKGHRTRDVHSGVERRADPVTNALVIANPARASVVPSRASAEVMSLPIRSKSCLISTTTRSSRTTHAVDNTLAPALQQTLRRFARPYPRRARQASGTTQALVSQRRSGRGFRRRSIARGCSCCWLRRTRRSRNGWIAKLRIGSP